MDHIKELLRTLSPRQAEGLSLTEGTVAERSIGGQTVLRVEIAGTDQEPERFSAPEGFALRAGDRLLLLTGDWQHFWILYKVVQL